MKQSFLSQLLRVELGRGTCASGITLMLPWLLKRRDEKAPCFCIPQGCFGCCAHLLRSRCRYCRRLLFPSLPVPISHPSSHRGPNSRPEGEGVGHLSIYSWLLRQHQVLAAPLHFLPTSLFRQSHRIFPAELRYGECRSASGCIYGSFFPCLGRAAHRSTSCTVRYTPMGGQYPPQVRPKAFTHTNSGTLEHAHPHHPSVSSSPQTRNCSLSLPTEAHATIAIVSRTCSRSLSGFRLLRGQILSTTKKPMHLLSP